MIGLRTIPELKLPDNRNAQRVPRTTIEKDKKRAINQKYFREWDGYFNDRFGLRDALRNFYTAMAYNINAHAKFGVEFYAANDGWIMGNSSWAVTFSENKHLQKFQKFQKFCDDNKIKCYVIPNFYSNYFYPEKSLGRVPLNPYDTHFFDIAQIAGVKTIDYISEFRKHIANDPQNSDLLFYKADHHPTDSAQFIIFSLLMKEIKKDFPKIKVLTADNFNIMKDTRVRADHDRKFEKYGRECVVYGLRKLCDTSISYSFYDHKDPRRVEHRDDKYKTERTYFCKDCAPLRVFVLGVSHAESLMQFVPHQFRDVRKIRTNSRYAKDNKMDSKYSMKFWGPEILNFKPDILVLYSSYYNFTTLDD